MLCKRGLSRHAVFVCLSVCLSVSVTFVHAVKMNKHILEICSPSSQAILAFSNQTAWQYSNGNPPNGGVECRWGRQKSRFCANIWLASLRGVNAATGQQLSTRCLRTTVPQVVTLIAGRPIKRPSLLMAGNNDEVYDKKSQC